MALDLYQRLKDKDIIFKINELFYEKVYEHPWLSLFFQDTPQEFITQQQTDFIIGAIGGENRFSGRMPSNAHPHMFIDDELFDLRKELLIAAMQELNAPEELQQTWIRIDESFRSVIVKKSPAECKGRFATDPLLIFENPLKKAS